MNARSMMPKRSLPPEPKTVPPPNGAKDAYSAPTRVGTLPEELLAAMRDAQTDAALAEPRALVGRTRSGTRPAQAVPVPMAPTPVPDDSQNLALGSSVEGAGDDAYEQPSYEQPSSSLSRPISRSITLVPPPTSIVPIVTPSPWSAPANDLMDVPQFRPSLARSLFVVALFALLGGIVAAVIMFWS